jgi:hypothetical protein
LILQLPVPVLEFFVLPGELPQLAFELLDPDIRINVIGLRPRRRAPRERAENNHRSQCRSAGHFM